MVKLPKDNACNLSLDASIYTHGDRGHIATPQEQSKMTNEEKLAHAKEIARALDLKYASLLNSPSVVKMAEANVLRMQYALEDNDQTWFDKEYLQTTLLG